MIKKKKYTHKVLFVCFPIIYLALIILVNIMDSLRLSSYNGVIMALGFTLCLILVMLDYKRGTNISFFLLGISAINTSITMLARHLISPLPGLVNTLIYIIIIFILCREFSKKEELIVTDVVTGLQNRRGVYKFLDSKTKSQQAMDVCVFYIDNFKLLNDNHGREYGDKLLSYVADVAKNKLGDRGDIFRLGGPEFVVTLMDTKNTDAIISDIVSSLGEKFDYEKDGASFANYLSVYAGISRYPQDTDNVEDLINYADMAMLQAVNNHKGRICYFDKSMEEEAQDDIEIEKVIEEGLKNDYFFMMYQPQYKIGDKSLRGFESLIRMKKPDGTLVSPGKFIPVAEKSDLIMKIDDYVITKALNEFKDAAFNARNPFVLSINISAKNIANIGFAESVIDKVKKIGFPADSLEIEITEYCLAKSIDIAIDNIEKLRNVGIQVALDDFGTGYTSLSYLSKLPINLLKIDKSLLDDIETNVKSKDFVNAVVSLGHMMNCEVISEGVEHEGQIEILKEQNCDFVQGFIWSKPLSFNDAIKEIK